VGSQHPAQHVSRGWWRLAGCGAAMLVSLALTACAAPHRLVGIDLRAPDLDPNIRALAERALYAQDRQAMLALGIALEEGQGIAANACAARQLYAMAAAPSGGTVMVYVPAAPAAGVAARVEPFDRGPRVEGLAEAKERLAKMTVRAC
jgi:hypothetical protein